MNASDYLESGILNHLFRSTTLAKPTTIAIALTSDLPLDTDDGTTMPELSGGAYARVDLGAPSDADWNFMTQFNGSGLIDNVNAITFPQATANWGMVSGVAIMDNATAGGNNLLAYGKLTTPRDVKTNDTFQFAAGDLDILLG